MIKVRWFTKNAEEKPQISIKVEGTLEIKDPDLADFESYKRKVRKEQLKKEIERYVDSLLKDPYRNSDLYICTSHSIGFDRAKATLAEKIMEHIEIE